MSDLASLHAIVYGHVQGVYFRAFVAEKAAGLGLTGYVRNLDTEEAVETWAEGVRDKLEELVKQLNIGPRHAKVMRVTTEWAEYSGKHKDFRIN